LVKARYKYIVTKHQIHDLVDVARLEVAGAFGTISNSAPAAFWLLYHLFSHPHILEECRRELSTLVEERDETCYLNANGIPKQCPTILSSFNEVLRYHGVQVSLRKVVEDHALDDKYLLKEGSALMMPATVQHFDPQIWGPNSGEFDHKRFIPTGHDGSKKGAQRAAFRGFGGGHHLCPGRHFATTEIVAFAALVILRFDMTPVVGAWTVLKTDKLSSKGSAVTLPDSDLEVRITPRDSKPWVVSRDSM
jgi:cytochrome P450